MTTSQTHDRGARAEALGFLGRFFSSGLGRDQFEEASAAGAECSRCEREAENAQGRAVEARTSALAARRQRDPEGVRRLSRSVAFCGAGACALLDVIPADMAAQAFGLDRTDTYAITVLIVAAMAGAMLLLDTGAAEGRHRGLLYGAVGAGFGLLFSLRVAFLTVAGADSPPGALLASAALTAVSAILVVFGSALLRRRMPKEVARAEAQDARATREAAETATALANAQAHNERARAALTQTVTVGALTGRPEGVDPVAFTGAVASEIDRLLAA
jgi:hypothetical protein